jgi:hypothetical protein
MFVDKGKIHYDDTDGLWVTLYVSQDLAEFYRRLIPPYLKVMRPRYKAHATVVRGNFDKPGKIRYWGDHEGEEVEFLYDPYPLNGNGYYWLNVWSKRLEEIRSELGLFNVSKYPAIPPGYDKTFHITIGRYEEVFDFKNEPEK